MKAARKTRARGFGLVEVMMAATMLAVAVGGTMTLISTLNQAYEHERLVMQSLHVAEAQLETLLVCYSTDSQLTAGNHVGPSYDVAGKAGGTFFATSWVITPAVPVANLNEVAVTVSWTENGRTKTLSLKTVRT